MLKYINFENDDRLVSFDVESLYTNVPVDEALYVIKSELAKDQNLQSRTTLPLEGVMDLLGCCLQNSYFQIENKFFCTGRQPSDGFIAFSSGSKCLYGMV